MDVSIILVNYNTKELTYDCIKSIREKTNGISYEIIVVDNASTDGSKELFILENSIKYIYLEKNLGFGQANNVGAKIAEGDYLFFLNTDTKLINNAISILYHFMIQKKGEVGVAGGILLGIDKKENGSYGSFPTIQSSLLRILGKTKNNLLYSATQENSLKTKGYCEVDYVLGADMMIEKQLFNTIKGFDSDFFMYYEESDLQKKCCNLNLKNYILCEAQIHHFINASVNMLANNKKRTMVNQSMLIYLKKHTSKTSFALFKMVFCFIEIIKILRGKYTIKENIRYIKKMIKI